MNQIFAELIKSTFGHSPVIKDLLPSPGSDSTDIMYIDPSKYTTPDGDSWSFQGVGKDFHYFKYDGYKSCVEAYERCPPVAAIINRKAQAFINGKTWVLNSKGKEAQGSDANKMRKLLKRPNPIQSWKQFEAQGYIFLQDFGFNIILPIRPFGFTDPLDTTSMWNIPASWIDIQATQEVFTRNGGMALEDIVVNFGGNRIVFKLKDLLIIRDSTPSFHTLTFPASKLSALQMPINNIIGAYESRNVLINYRGALGILTADPGKGQFAALPISKEEKTALEKDFRRYGLRSKQFQVIMTTASLKWQSMGYPTKDLMLMEEVEESTVSICANLNFPPFILGLRDTTFNNMAAAERALYQNATIPDAESIYEQLTSYFQLEDRNMILNKDYSHIESLQADRVATATARKTLDEALKAEFDAGLITIDDWLIEIGRDPLPNGLGQIRSTDPKNVNVPLASVIGVGGVTALISVLTASLPSEPKAAVLEIVFGISPADAERMAGQNVQNETATTAAGTQTQEANQG